MMFPAAACHLHKNTISCLHWSYQIWAYYWSCTCTCSSTHDAVSELVVCQIEWKSQKFSLRSHNPKPETRTKYKHVGPAAAACLGVTTSHKFNNTNSICQLISCHLMLTVSDTARPFLGHTVQNTSTRHATAMSSALLWKTLWSHRRTHYLLKKKTRNMLISYLYLSFWNCLIHTRTNNANYCLD